MKKNVLCIEGNWDKGFNKQKSIKLALDYLEENSEIKNNYQRATSKEELYRHLHEASLKRNESFKIIYVACHGGRGSISLNHNHELSLEELAENCKDKLKGKLILFGCCSTLHISEFKINSFLQVSGAKAVAGYSRSIEFHESTFLDMLLIDRYQYTDSIKILERQMNKYYEGFIQKLGFKMIY